MTTPAAPMRSAHFRPADGAVVVAERLERGNRGSLQRERPRERHVEDESGQQKDQRQQDAEILELRELVLERPVRELQRARDRAEAAASLKDAIEACDHHIGRRARRQRDCDVVKATLHVEGGGERLPVHPEHAEPLVVRHQLARADVADVLRAKAPRRQS